MFVDCQYRNAAMFKVKNYLIERLRGAYSLHHARYYHAGKFHQGRRPHRCCRGRAFFSNNTKNSADIDVVQNVTDSSAAEANVDFAFHQLYASSSYHDYHLNSYHTRGDQCKALGIAGQRRYDEIFFKNARFIDSIYPLSGYHRVAFSNQSRSFATEVKSTDLLAKIQITQTSERPDEEYTDLADTNLIDKEQLVENFTKPIDFSDPIEQLRLFEKLESQGKYNEMLANFQFLLNSGYKPGLDIYNKTLSSIKMRKNTGETLEEGLTNLLNVYSTMLTNDVKPDLTTYTLVLSTLLKGSMTAVYDLQNYHQGSQYFEVARLLFAVCDHKTLTFGKSFYELFLGCYSTFGVIPSDVEGFKALFNMKLGDHNPVYYLYMMKLFVKDSENFNKIFNDFKKFSQDDEVLLSSQFKVYQLYIENLIHLDQLDQATVLLDQILNQIKGQEFFEDVSSGLISSYLETLSLYDVAKTHEIFVIFDSLPWLPDLKISSLLSIIYNCLKVEDYQLLTKFWNYTIIRNDFNSISFTKDWSNTEELILNPELNNSQIINAVIEASLSTEEMNPVRLIKESMLKEIVLSNDNVMKILNFLIETKQSEAFITNFIVNQGYKQPNFNQYLSSIIDLVPNDIQYNLTKSNFFKNCCEKYKLISDNFYGIYRNLSVTWDCKDMDITPKLKYYYSVIYSQLNDIDNYYVEIPQELENFKVLLKLKLDDCV